MRQDNPIKPIPEDGSGLSSRTTLLVLASVLGGFVVGQIDGGGAVGYWTTMFSAIAVTVTGMAVAYGLVIRPLRRLAVQLEGVSLEQRHSQLRELPIHRRDEVGRIARAMRRLCIACIRDHHNARQLRRNLDERVQDATQQAVKRLSAMAMRDPLTDLGNRHFLDENVPPLVTAARHTGEDFTCLMIDLDHFKQVNDTYGHSTGDDLLIQVAGLIRQAVRAEDLVVRLGGDEFAVFLPGAGLDRAADIAHDIRAHFHQATADHIDPALRCDLSVGAASLKQDHARDSAHLMELADRQLYRAKRSGRGRICAASNTQAA